MSDKKQLPDKCAVTRDLMPLCIDGTASEASQRKVDKHVADCDPCAVVYREMQTQIDLDTPDQQEAAQFDTAVKKVKHKHAWRKLRNVLLGIALALVNDPELLILDEPVNGLDPMGMVAVRELLRSLCTEDGITILISSHILAELYQLVTDYIIISQGQIVETLSKAELDERCTAFLLLETDEPTKAAQVLRAGGVRQLVQEGHTLRLFDAPSAESVARQLFDARILVTALEKHETTLEEYYMKLLGRAVQ